MSQRLAFSSPSNPETLACHSGWPIAPPRTKLKPLPTFSTMRQERKNRLMPGAAACAVKYLLGTGTMLVDFMMHRPPTVALAPPSFISPFRPHLSVLPSLSSSALASFVRSCAQQSGTGGSCGNEPGRCNQDAHHEHAEVAERSHVPTPPRSHHHCGL